MRSRAFIVLIAVGVVLIVVGLIAIGHYHGAHSICNSSHPLLPKTCSRVKRRFIGGFVVAAIGLVVVVGAAVEGRRR